MASFRIVAAVVALTGATILATVSSVSAQTVRAAQAAPIVQAGGQFARCPKSAEQYTEVMRQLVAQATRARVLADQNPLLEPDAAFYEAELAATKSCGQTVAKLATR